jgi:hypothetical protein
MGWSRIALSCPGSCANQIASGWHPVLKRPTLAICARYDFEATAIPAGLLADAKRPLFLSQLPRFGVLGCTMERRPIRPRLAG